MPDKAAILDHLARSGAVFTNAFRALAPKQFFAKPGPNQWSIAETVEHVTIVELGSGKLIRTKLTESEADAALLAQAEDGTARIEARLGPEGGPFQAPERVLPKGRWQSAEEMLAVFEENRAATIDFIEGTSLDLTRYVAPHPRFGPIHGLDWAYFLALHSERHVLQIERIKQSPTYPA
ncbi:MAG: DinB family protein [Gemmatimonadales bacterium]|nr:DinB family protein [Gemmatimonadales bacterium]